MNPTALLSTFITLGFLLPAAGKAERFLSYGEHFSFTFTDFSTSPVGFRDKMKGLFNKSLDILTKVNF